MNCLEIVAEIVGKKPQKFEKSLEYDHQLLTAEEQQFLVTNI